MSDGGLTGSARVLAILRCLGERPAGARLGDVAAAVEAPKSSVHRALAALVTSGFARQDADGVYHLGFDLLQLVFGYHESQQSSLTVEPVLRRLADATGETTHYGVLVGADIVYQAKVSPTRKTFQMSSVIGGANPAYRTGLGKALLMHRLRDLAAVRDYVNQHGPLLAKTAHTLTTAEQLDAAFREGRSRGFAMDLQENDLGIACIAFPLFLDSPSIPAGALSISAVSSRTSPEELIAQATLVRGIVGEELGERVLTPEPIPTDGTPTPTVPWTPTSARSALMSGPTASRPETSDLTITEVEAVFCRLDEIDADRCDGTQDTLLIFVTASDGTVGVGEVDSAPLVAKAVVEAEPSHLIARGLRSILLGRNPLDLDVCWHAMVSGSRYFSGGATMHAISGVDIALWDLAGQVLGLPVARLLGGARSEWLDAYASLVMPDTPVLAAKEAARYAERGYRKIKFGWGPIGQDLAFNESLVREIRRAAGDEVMIMIDAGQVWDTKTALRMAAMLESYAIGWLEEPVAPDNLTGYRALSERSSLVIAGGEAESDYAAFERLIDEGGVDLIQPDLARCGGLTQGRRLAWLAHQRHRRVVPHAFKSGVLVAASTHFAAAIPNGGLIEHTVSTSPIARDLVRREIGFVDGRVRVPLDRPGLGIEVDREVLERLRVG